MTWIALAVGAALALTSIILCILSKDPAMVEIEPQPCVSDAEFCKLLPQIPRDVALKVRSVLVDVSGWEREEIHPDTRLIEFED